MQRRNRDIQIFNLSMMDVITGAMGAFLIVMLVLARYYNADPENKENIEAIKAELDSAQAQLRQIEAQFRKAGIDSPDIPSAIREATKDVASAQKKTDALNEQLDQSAAEIERLKKTIRTLQKRRAFSISSTWNCPGTDVDIYVWDSQLSVKKEPVPEFDPKQERWSRWGSDRRVSWDDENTEVWLVTKSLLDEEFKVYLNVRNMAQYNGSCTVKTAIVHARGGLMYTTTLSPGNPWEYISRLRSISDEEDDETDFVIETPSESEKAVERTRITNG